jgi:hypothetical protein
MCELYAYAGKTKRLIWAISLNPFLRPVAVEKVHFPQNDSLTGWPLG